jgi:hypothetical protein
MLSTCHAQQDAASHQPWHNIELSSCAKAPTDRAVPAGFICLLPEPAKQRAASTGMMECE